jgi:anti-anti-sigma regulatory factor
VKLGARINGNVIVLKGRIDDSAQLVGLAEHMTAGPIVIDTNDVTFVNSIGVREWMRMMRALRERGCTVTLVRVADVLMTQFNLIPELAKSATIVSFRAPYECPACGAEASPIVEVAAHVQLLRQMQVPPLPCPECRAAMELADIPERFLTVFRG